LRWGRESAAGRPRWCSCRVSFREVPLWPRRPAATLSPALATAAGRSLPPERRALRPGQLAAAGSPTREPAPLQRPRVHSAFATTHGEGAVGPEGSDDIEAMILDYFASHGLPTEPTAFDGRSDFGPFIAAGIPCRASPCRSRRPGLRSRHGNHGERRRAGRRDSTRRRPRDSASVGRPARALRRRLQAAQLLVDNEAEHHAALVVLRYVAVSHPVAGIRDVEQDVDRLARPHEHRVLPH
jgi:hypothetical protein